MYTCTCTYTNAIILCLYRHIVGRCGSDSALPLKMLVQNVCCSTPDRAEYRNKIVGVVSTLLGLFDDHEYSLLLEWISKLSRNAKVCKKRMVF